MRNGGLNSMPVWNNIAFASDLRHCRYECYPPARYVLDTNIISALLQGTPSVGERFGYAMNQRATFLLCPFVWYEMQRWLLRRRATRQLRQFDLLIANFEWEELVPEDWQLAASTWPHLVVQGQQPDDANLLIAVFAARRQATMVTQNQKHFQLAASLLTFPLENWI